MMTDTTNPGECTRVTAEESLSLFPLLVFPLLVYLPTHVLMRAVF